MTVHFGTFDAERWWRPPDLAGLPAVADAGADRLVRAMDQLLAVECRPGDRLVTAGPVSDRHRETMAGAGIDLDHHVVATGPGTDPDPGTAPALSPPVEEHLVGSPPFLRLAAGHAPAPYAVLEATERLAARLGATGALPTAAAVATVNSKTWSNGLVVDLGLPGAGTVVRSGAQLRCEVERLGADVVIKDPFGVAGRGSLVLSGHPGGGAAGVGRGALDAVVRHLDRQVGRGRRVELLVQPLFHRALDFSAHLALDRRGHIDWRGWQVARTAGGAYLGSEPAPPGLAGRLGRTWDPHLEAVAGALAAEGYWGPVCIDGLVRSDGTVVPLLEINARRSLGSLNLTLTGRVADLGLASWLRRCDLRWPGPVDADDAANRDPAGDAGGGGRGDGVLEAWAAAGLLYRRGRPGVLPLALGDSGGARGRAWYAVLAPGHEEAAALDATARRALAAARLLPEATRAA
jgi:hypothetical protein